MCSYFSLQVLLQLRSLEAQPLILFLVDEYVPVAILKYNLLKICCIILTSCLFYQDSMVSTKEGRLPDAKQGDTYFLNCL